jgi:hypothetical protein
MGSGFRTFTAGEVLTASNVQNYLQDQVVMTFAGSAARSSAIGTANFEEGMVSYLTDTDKVEAYNGTNWVQVGSSNQGLTLINTTSFSGVSSQLFSLTGSYENYLVIISHTGTTADSDALLRVSLNGTPASGSNYNGSVLGLTNSGSGTNLTSASATSFKYATNETASTTEFAGFVFNLIDVNVARNTKITSHGTTVNSPGAVSTFVGSCLHEVSTAYNQVQFFPSTGNFSGRASVYGYSS